MVFRQFLQNLFERVGLAEAPLPPPQAAHVVIDDPGRLPPIFLRLAAWGVKQVQLVAGEMTDPEDVVAAARHAAASGLETSVRGRASDLIAGELLADLSSTGVREVEIPLLSAVAEVHDSLAGLGDYRSALKLLDGLAKTKMTPAVQLVLTPSTGKTVAQTLEMLEARRIRDVRIWPIVCRDDEPASWALSASQLVEVAKRIESEPHGATRFAWYPPQRFNRAETLAQQVRRGPRAAQDAVRIEPDGSTLPPIGPATAGGNVAQNDWKLIARSEVFRAWKRRRAAPQRCDQCPGVAACADGCLRDAGNWAEG